MMARFRNFYSLQKVKTEGHFIRKRRNAFRTGAKSYFSEKKYFGVRCTLTRTKNGEGTDDRAERQKGEGRRSPTPRGKGEGEGGGTPPTTLPLPKGNLRRNKKQTAVINIRKYKRNSGKKKGFILTFRMFQHTSSEVVNR